MMIAELEALVGRKMERSTREIDGLDLSRNEHNKAINFTIRDPHTGWGATTIIPSSVSKDEAEAERVVAEMMLDTLTSNCGPALKPDPGYFYCPHLPL